MQKVFSLRPKSTVASVKVADTSVFSLNRPVTAMKCEDVLQSLKYAIMNYPGFSFEEDDLELVSTAADGKVLSSPYIFYHKDKESSPSQELY